MTMWRSRMIIPIAIVLVAMGTAPTAWASSHIETLVAFDPEAGQLPEGVTVDQEGTVFASLSPLGQLVKIEAGSAEPFGAVDGIMAGDFGLIGLNVGPDGDIYGGVFSANPDAHGVWRFDASTGNEERIAGSQEIGMANALVLDANGTMYVSDTIGGAIWRVTPGDEAELWIADQLLEGTGEAGFGIPLGANGIAVSDDTVYVGVTETARIVTVPVNPDGSAGEASISVQLEVAVDGVTLDDNGDLYLAHPIDNLVSRVSADGAVETVADVDDGLDGPASVALGVGANGERVLYVSNFSVALGGPLGAGPSIVAIKLDKAD